MLCMMIGSLGLKEALVEIKKGWLVDTPYHGLSKLYVKACVDAYVCLKVQKTIPLDIQHRTNSCPPEEFVVEESMVRVVLGDI